MSPTIIDPAEFCHMTGACNDGVKFALQHQHMADVWDKCPRGEWLLWIIERLDTRVPDQHYKAMTIETCQKAMLFLNERHRGACEALLKDFKTRGNEGLVETNIHFALIREIAGRFTYPQAYEDLSCQTVLLFSMAFEVFSESSDSTVLRAQARNVLLQLYYIRRRAPLDKWWIQLLRRKAIAEKEGADIVRACIPNPFLL